MDNAPLGWMPKQTFLKALYLDCMFLSCHVLRILFFLIYINDLPNKLTSNLKLLPDDTSLFSVVTDPNATANQINNDLYSINK